MCWRQYGAHWMAFARQVSWYTKGEMIDACGSSRREPVALGGTTRYMYRSVPPYHATVDMDCTLDENASQDDGTWS